MNSKVYFPFKVKQKDFCTLDKASSNFGLVCKKLYLLNLMSEIGIKCDKSLDTLV